MDLLYRFLNWCMGHFLPCIIVFYVFLVLIAFFIGKALINSFKVEKTDIDLIVKSRKPLKTFNPIREK